ncbi:AAA family ATPase [Bacillus sp. NA_146.1]
MNVLNVGKREFILESFEDIKRQMEIALVSEDLETTSYLFIRSFRLLYKVENDLFPLKKDMSKEIGRWYEKLACLHEKKGEDDKAEQFWLSALSFTQDNASYYIQYGHAVLRRKHLYIHKELVDNLKQLSPYNVKEVKQAIQRARFSFRTALQYNNLQKESQECLNVIAELEGEIERNPLFAKQLLEKKEIVSVEKTMAELDELIGLQSVKQKVKEIYNLVIFNQMRKEQGMKTDNLSLHMVFTGNPGTGKTIVARLVAKIFKALGVLSKGHLVETDRSELVGEFVGHTAPKTMKKIKEALGGVLFVDEAYSLTRSGSTNDFGMEAIDTLVKAMEDNRENLIVILAGYPNEMNEFIESNPGLRSRFNIYVDFPDYTVDELLLIQDLMFDKKEYKITSGAKERVRYILNKKIELNPKSHGNGRLMRNLVEEIILQKAYYAVSQGQKKELDSIDEEIINRVERTTKILY